MLKDNSQKVLDLSPYQGLYEAIIPRDHILRRLKDSIDFSFANPMMSKQYCENFGRPAKEPEMMFKLLFLKKLYDLSDEQLISRAQTDMAYNSAYMALQLAKGHGNKRIVCAQTSDNGMANGNSIMQEIAEYIHQNYTIAGLSLNDLSEAIHLSPSHLCRLIKKYENTNFMVWLTKVRVKMAAELIRTTDMKVYEICEKVGYNNPQYFSVVFKKYMG